MSDDLTYSTVSAEAPGKIVLLGEYAVLEGAPALVAAVNRYCRIQIARSKNSFFSLKALNLKLPDLNFNLDKYGNTTFSGDGLYVWEKEAVFLMKVIHYIADRLKGNIPGASITIDSDEFYHSASGRKLGLGSSAALTVAFIRALNEYTGIELSVESLFAEALKAHRTGQDRLGSGVDVAASVAGGVIRYQMPESEKDMKRAIKPCSRPLDLFISVIWTGKSASTRTMLQRVSRFRNEQPSAYDKILQAMSDLSEQGCTAFNAGDTASFLDIIPAFVEQEKELGKYSGADIISDVHGHLASLVEGAGGVYKPSGAGGGDIGIAFYGSREIHQQISNAVHKSPFEILDIDIHF